MKLLVLSDSHGCVNKLKTAVDLEKPQAIAFLGDCVRDYLEICDSYIGVLHFIVAGNCDLGASGFSERIIADIFGKRFYLTHGHRENVKSGYLKLCMNALENECDAALFGHTHLTCKNYYSGVEILNPGSISCGDYGIVEIDEEGNIETSLRTIYSGGIDFGKT